MAWQGLWNTVFRNIFDVCLICVWKYKPGGLFWISIASYCMLATCGLKLFFCCPSAVTSRRSAVILRSCPRWPYEAGKRQDGECTTPEVKGTAVCKVLFTG